MKNSFLRGKLFHINLSPFFAKVNNFKLSNILNVSFLYMKDFVNHESAWNLYILMIF